MNIVIQKATACGTIKAQPSKSMAHRYIICAMLSEGESRIRGLAESEDILATMDCARALGAELKKDGEDLLVRGISDRKPAGEIVFSCRESGSTMRFFMGIAMGLGCRARFYGSRTLLQRPFSVYEEIAKRQGITFVRNEDHILVDGKLQPGDFEIPGDVSSQFISGLLFVLPLLEKDSRIVLLPPVESRSYIDLTLQALRDFGVCVENDLSIGGKQSYRCNTIDVEGDMSNAAFPDALNLLGGSVKITGLSADSSQGDRVYREYFQKLREGDACLDLTDCPDLGPVLFAVAACLHGGTFTGTRRLKMKESDRGTVMCEELAKCGVGTHMEDDSVRILPSVLHAPDQNLLGHNDHRIVMALSVILTRTGGTIEGAQAVSKSYPTFFDDLKSLGIPLERVES
ncbi:MAG: 3-phosphoshikimate 1-carboxyvinyltransferase [Lachnospiraceae bacterium]|nr:3-phosphoshikimate 1-carboxyvinyltransferase [Lachnospiraceae bacterium]